MTNTILIFIHSLSDIDIENMEKPEHIAACRARYRKRWKKPTVSSFVVSSAKFQADKTSANIADIGSKTTNLAVRQFINVTLHLMYALSIQMQPNIKKQESYGDSETDSAVGVMSEEDDGSDTESEEEQENEDDEENMGYGNRHLGFHYHLVNYSFTD